jgi:ribosomal subunit interface protein
MNKQFTFKGMEHSNALETYAREHIKKIETFLQEEQERDPIYMRMSFDAETTHHHHKIEFNLKSPRYDIHVHKEGPDMYKLVNEVADVMYESLHKEKQRRVDEQKTGLKKRE